MSLHAVSSTHGLDVARGDPVTALAAAAADPFRLCGPELPTRADLDAATAATQAAIDRHAPAAEVIAAAEIEAGTLHAYAHRPGAEAELQAGI